MAYDFSAVVLDCREYKFSPIKPVIEKIFGTHGLIVTSDPDIATDLLRSGQDIRLLLLDCAPNGPIAPECVKQFRNGFTDLRVLVASPVLDFDLISAFLLNGAHGCVLKSEPESELERAIRTVVEGEIYLPSFLDTHPGSDDLDASRRSRIERSIADIGQIENASGVAGIGRLSKRQKHVLGLVAKGLSNKAIARELDLSEGTVKVHISSAFKSLNVNNRVQAVTKMISERMFG